MRFRVPLGSRLGLHGRGDVAGFGSDFSWNLQGGLDVALGQRWAFGAGYRHLDVDYDSEKAGERQLFRMKFDGAYSFVSFAWWGGRRGEERTVMESVRRGRRRAAPGKWRGRRPPS